MKYIYYIVILFILEKFEKKELRWTTKWTIKISTLGILIFYLRIIETLNEKKHKYIKKIKKP